MQYFCELHDDYYFNAVKFDYKECSSCNNTHELDYQLACKKCQSSRKINYNHVINEIEKYERQLKSSAQRFRECIMLVSAHFQNEYTFYFQANLDVENHNEQIKSSEERLTKMKQQIRFILDLMDVEGFRHSTDEEIDFTDYKKLLPGPHYIEPFSQVLREITDLNCALSSIMGLIDNFESDFKQNKYIQRISFEKHKGNDILYTMSPIVKLYIGGRILKVKQGQGIETYNSEEESGKSEGQWQNDQLIDGTKTIKKPYQERYYNGQWKLEGQHATLQEWDKDRQFMRGVKKISDLQNQVIITYLGQWNNEQFEEGALIIQDTTGTKIWGGIWHNDVFIRGNHKIINTQSNTTTEYTGEWNNEGFKGEQSISDNDTMTIYEGVWNQNDFWTGTKVVIKKNNNDKLKTKFYNGREEKNAVVQNPSSEWIFEGVLTHDNKYLNGRLYHRLREQNFYNGSFQGDNQKNEGSEYVNNQLRYQGTYKNDKYHGKGILFQSDGASQQMYYLISYKGFFVNGEMHGRGQMMKALVRYRISEGNEQAEQNDKPISQEQYYEKGAPEELCPLF